MRVLVIEDNEYRKSFFLELLKGNVVDTASTATKALEKLRSSSYDMIYLDYDLDNNEKGIKVAQEISSTRNGNSEVIIHSMNIPEAKKIQKFLPEARLSPFAEIERRSLASILCRFGTEAAKEHFLNLCREYYGEHVRQEAAKRAGQLLADPHRPEIHNQLMDIVQKLYLEPNDPIPSPEAVGLMVTNHFGKAELGE